MEFMPTHFNGRFDDERGCCKIRDLQEELKDDPQFLTKVVIGFEIFSNSLITHGPANTTLNANSSKGPTCILHCELNVHAYKRRMPRRCGD